MYMYLFAYVPANHPNNLNDSYHMHYMYSIYLCKLHTMYEVKFLRLYQLWLKANQFF